MSRENRSRAVSLDLPVFHLERAYIKHNPGMELVKVEIVPFYSLLFIKIKSSSYPFLVICRQSEVGDRPRDLLTEHRFDSAETIFACRNSKAENKFSPQLADFSLVFSDTIT